MNNLIALMVLGVAFLSNPVKAANYYIDPASGSLDNPGTAAQPWNTLAAVAAAKSFASGDSVFLLSGKHGRVTISGTYDAPLVITAAAGAVPQLTSLSLNASKNIVFDRLTITADAAVPYLNVGNLVTLRSGASFVTVQNCSLYSRRDASRWTTANYRTEAAHAFFFEPGTNHVIRNNIIFNVQNAIPVGKGVDSVLVEYNTITHFWEDALRGCGDYGTYRCNLIKNPHKGAFHEDAFQAYATPWDGSASVKGCVVSNNTIINRDDPGLAYPAPLQGISCFDGFTEGWKIENNLVVVDAYHGISLYGAVNCTIINNTVIPQPGNAIGDRTWIGLYPHKNAGTSVLKSRGNLVRNNLCRELFLGTGLPDSSYSADHNIASLMYKLYLTDYNGGDYTLKPGVPAYGGQVAIDAGTDEGAPALDIMGTSRPLGNGTDIGCYEYDPSGAVHGTGYLPTTENKGVVSVYPNPLQHDGFLECDVPGKGVSGLTVFDTAGHTVLQTTVRAGIYRIPVNRRSLGGGVYAYAMMQDGSMLGRGCFTVR